MRPRAVSCWPLWVQDRARTNGARNYGRESHARGVRGKGGVRGAEQRGTLTTKTQRHEARDEEAELRLSTLKFLRGNPFVHSCLCGESSACRRVRKLDVDVRPLDLEREFRVLDSRVEAVAAGGHVELPAVPRTRHHGPVQAAFAQRPPGVRTNSIQRVKRALNVKERDHSSAGRKFARGAGSNFPDRRQPMPLRHACPMSLIRGVHQTRGRDPKLRQREL